MPWCVRLPFPLSSRTHDTQVDRLVGNADMDVGPEHIAGEFATAVSCCCPWKEHVRVMLISVFCEYAHSEGSIVRYVARKSRESSQVAAVG